MPLDDAYSFDFGTTDQEKDKKGAEMVSESADKIPISVTDETKNATNETKGETNIKKNAAKPELSQDEKKILSVIRKDSRITPKENPRSNGNFIGNN